MRSIGALAAVVTALTISAATAQAEVRSGTAGPVTIGYDDVSGTVTVAGGPLSGQLKTYCSAYTRPEDAPPAEPAVDITAGADAASAAGPDGVQAAFTGPGSATVYGPGLIGSDLRCFEGTAGGAPLLLYFNGYAHVPLTAASARSAVIASLRARYPGLTDSRITYLKCPQRRLRSDGVCRYQIGRGGTVRTGAYQVSETETAVLATRVAARTYSQRQVRCPRRYEGNQRSGDRWIVEKQLRAPRSLCSAAMIRGITTAALRAFPKPRRSFSGRVSPYRDFEEQGVYRCAVRVRRGKEAGRLHYLVRCANRTGDRVTLTFTALRHEQARPSRKA